ncbi:MAG: MFS transporter [Clostridia bacterium]|nr:MFS transporter [Clostridia bacterium]
METSEVQKSSSKYTPKVVSVWLVVLCWTLYATIYISRGNLSIVRSIMIDKGVFDVGVAGIVGAVYFTTYAVGQVINGLIADKRPPFLMVLLGLIVALVGNLGMSFHQPPFMYAVWWGLNGFGQSMLWSPVFYIVSNMIDPKYRYIAVIALGISAPIGKVASSLGSGAVIGDGAWENAFYLGTLTLAAVSLLWVSGFLSVKKRIVEIRPENEKPKEKICFKESFGHIRRGGFLLFIPALIAYGLFYNGIVEIVPSLLTESYDMSPSSAAVLNTVIPIIGIVGVLISKWIFKLCRNNELTSSLVSMSLCLIPVLAMFTVSVLGGEDGFLFSQETDAWLFVISYGLIYMLQCTFGTFMISYVPLRFATFGCAAMATGVFNAVANVGSAMSIYGMSYAVELLPLWVTISIWIGVITVACIVMIPALVRWRRFTNNRL